MLTGFRGAVASVVLVALLGVVLSYFANRAARSRPSQESVVGTPDAVDAIMKTDVYALSTDQTVLEALQTFIDRGISGAPVLGTDGKLAGFLSDRDVMRYLSATHPSSTSIYSYALNADADLEQAMSDLADLNIMRIATPDVITVESCASIADAVAALSDQRLKKVPVVDPIDDRPVGIINRSAINRYALANNLKTRRAKQLDALTV